MADSKTPKFDIKTLSTSRHLYFDGKNYRTWVMRFRALLVMYKMDGVLDKKLEGQEQYKYATKIKGEKTDGQEKTQGSAPTSSVDGSSTPTEEQKKAEQERKEQDIENARSVFALLMLVLN